MTLEAVVHDPGAGDSLSLRGTKVRVLTTAATSVGASTFEFLAAPGFDTGSHYHTRVEEQFYVLEGEIEVRADDRLVEATPGTFIALPTGVPHGFANRTGTVSRLLIVTTPPGHEQYFDGLAEILSREGAPDPEEIGALRARFDTVQVSALTT